MKQRVDCTVVEISTRSRIPI